MNEPVRASAVWKEALAIIVRHPVATVVPALFLGVLTETPHLLPDHRSFLETALAFVVESPAFYLYVAVRGATHLGGSPQSRVVCGRLRLVEDRARS